MLKQKKKLGIPFFPALNKEAHEVCEGQNELIMLFMTVLKILEVFLLL
jgi:hypothetical protein